MNARKRRKEKKGKTLGAPAGQTAPLATRKRTTLARAVLLGGILVAILFVVWTIYHAGAAKPKQETVSGHGEKRFAPEDGPPQKKEPPPAVKKEKDPDLFLDTFGNDSAPAEEAKGAPLANDELEKRFFAVEKFKEEHKVLVDRVLAWSGSVNKKDYDAAVAERERMVARLEAALKALENEMARARKARPADPVVAWLTAELLIFIGAEPELILPHLHKARDGGLARPRLLASLARTETEANQLGKAYVSATKALDADDKDRYVWRSFGQAAFHLEKFNEVLGRLDRAFPGQAPDWAKAVRVNAQEYQTRWQEEQKLRRAEEKADDLPRVRVIVEYRRFARDPEERAMGKIETTGTGEFILELFEDQAPASVANFLSLVAAQTYEGTRFHLVESASVIAGGDPQSRTGAPADDGTGGPGYVIPDEFNRAGARQHYRGSISMVNTGPRTAGSQFFITLVPKHEMDGFFTVFGRVIKGMEVLDAMTRGRTNPQVGRYGQLVPGDLLIRAEVLRKRPHEYKVIRDHVK